jgi:hypothetical protein
MERLHKSDNTHRSLSGQEMLKLNPDARLLKYTDLYKYNNIEDVFKDKKKIILLYLLQSEYSGHWVCLFLNKKGLNFYDSYGVPYDYQLDILTPERRKQLNEEQDYLSKLLYDYPVYYNEICYQGKGTETCGCFVTHRLHNSHLTDSRYLESLVKKGVTNPDKFVADYCFNKLF